MNNEMEVTERQMEFWLLRLPRKEREEIRTKSVSKEEMRQRVQRSRDAMKQDLWVGIPWFLAYTLMWFTTGVSFGTIALTIIGIVYFTYSYFTAGSYGVNRRRVKIYEHLLENKGKEKSKK
ncbi:MAG: hypothetical protein IPL49_02635 [Saprospirales bacterium]|nr:hypothetical protein [Saprospirales bacterium]MBK8489814.1 hypothetical protein [Saprospirales bacterium]